VHLTYLKYLTRDERQESEYIFKRVTFYTSCILSQKFKLFHKHLYPACILWNLYENLEHTSILWLTQPAVRIRTHFTP